jgi:hypothetical protein
MLPESEKALRKLPLYRTGQHTAHEIALQAKEDDHWQ